MQKDKHDPEGTLVEHLDLGRKLGIVAQERSQELEQVDQKPLEERPTLLVLLAEQLGHKVPVGHELQPGEGERGQENGL